MKRNIFVLSSFTGEVKKLYSKVFRNKKDRLNDRKKNKESLKEEY